MTSPAPGHLCVFAKPPLPGAAKTRLIPALGAEGAAALARASLIDTWRALAALPVARVLACTAPQIGVPELAGAELWEQGEGGLELRLERILARALERGPWAMAVGADSPGMPTRRVREAIAALADHDAVLGPADDGGFYLLGLRRCPPGLLHGIPWSAPTTFAQTRAALQAAGMQVAVLEPWFDVDEPADVERLRRLLASGELEAPECRRLLLGAP